MNNYPRKSAVPKEVKRINAIRAVVMAPVLYVTICCIFGIFHNRIYYGCDIYLSVDSEQKALVQDHMGIDLSCGAKGIRYDDRRYTRDKKNMLWAKGIADPEKFMEDNFEGDYRITDMSSVYLGDNESINYSIFKDDTAYMIYKCNISDEKLRCCEYYYIAFYEDGSDYKMKAVREWRNDNLNLW